MSKILIAVHHFPPQYTGGAENRAFRTALALQNRGHTVQVACIESITDDTTDPIRSSDEIYQGLPIRRYFFCLASAPDKFRWEYFNPWIGDQIPSLIREFRPDIFHLFSGYLMTASALNAAFESQIRTVVSLTDFWFLCARINMLRSNGQLDSRRTADQVPRNTVECARCMGEEQRRYRIPGRFLPGLMNLYWSRQTKRIQEIQLRNQTLLEALNRVDVILSPSQFLRDVYIQAGVEPKRIHYLRQGVDLSSLKPLPPRPFSPPLRIGYIGQIANHKGVHILVKAVCSLPEDALDLSIIGDATKFPNYTQKLMDQTGGDPRVHFTKPVEQGSMPEVYRNFDVVAVPSLWYENSPNVILEAFACQIPVIASNLGGMAELVQDRRNGLLFEVGDDRDLARKLKSLLDNARMIDDLRMNIPPVKSEEQEINELSSIYLN